MSKIIILDLDGTILPANGHISNQIIDDFDKLKKDGYTRVIATGRSIYSFYKVVEEDFPIDYLVFSSGSGILNWKTKELIYQKDLTEMQTKSISEKLISNNIDFMILDPAPHSHFFKYHKTDNYNSDFQNRFKLYSKYNSKIENIEDCNSKACQLLVIIPNEIERFQMISNLFDDINIIRCTSPIDEKSIWLEIFPINVSKGLTCLWLMNKLGININNSIGIGNDYNDIDFLDLCRNSYIVENSDTFLKERYNTIPSLFNNSIYNIKELQNSHK